MLQINRYQAQSRQVRQRLRLLKSTEGAAKGSWYEEPFAAMVEILLPDSVRQRTESPPLIRDTGAKDGEARCMKKKTPSAHLSRPLLICAES